MEGRLRREGSTWVGESRGYFVHIRKHDDAWYVWLMPGGQWTERCLRVGSLAEGAKVARDWIEKRLGVRADHVPRDNADTQSDTR
jgi:hypothetical protein